MLDFLSGITVTCFVSSYLIALALELTRAWIRLPARGIVIRVFTILGLTLHLLFLVLRAIPTGGSPTAGLLAGWFDWSLLLAWGLAACYLFLLLRRPKTAVGAFLLPPVLALIGLAMFFHDAAPFSRAEAAGIWRSVHGFSMLIGSVAVLLGFLAGLMYLTQSSKLKHKRAGTGGLKLPTLETLQKLNRRCLFFSTGALAVGLLSGAVMNLNRWGYVDWTEPGVLSSGVLLLWLLAATLFEIFYKPARQGRKVVYLTLASFVFLVLAMLGVLTSPHGRNSSESRRPPAAKGERASALSLPRTLLPKWFAVRPTEIAGQVVRTSWMRGDKHKARACGSEHSPFSSAQMEARR